MNSRKIAMGVIAAVVLGAVGFAVYGVSQNELNANARPIDAKREADARAAQQATERQQFADQVLARVLSQPDGHGARLIGDEFKIVLPVDDGGWGGDLFLANGFDEYRAADPKDRDAIVERYGTIHHQPPAPDSFQAVRANLLPVLRERAFFDDASRIAHERAPDAGEPAPFVPVGDLYGAALAIDQPESMAYVSADELQRWSKTLPELLDLARKNLAARSAGELEHPAPGVCASPWHDNYDASRVLLDEVLARCKVDGAQVVMLPNRDTLLIAGDHDPAALARLAELAAKEADKPRLMGLRALRRTPSGWARFMPEPTSKAFPAFHNLELISEQRDYEQQKLQLQKQLTLRGQDVFVASFQVMQNKDGEQLSVSTWTKDVECLLPRTELVGLMDLGRAQGHGLRAMARWEDLAKLMGPRLAKEPDVAPERYRVKGFPSDEELKKLGFAIGPPQ